MNNLEFCIYKQKKLCKCFPKWKSAIFLDVNNYKKNILNCFKNEEIKNKEDNIFVQFENESSINFLDFNSNGCADRINSFDVFPSLDNVSDDFINKYILHFYIDYDILYFEKCGLNPLELFLNDKFMKCDDENDINKLKKRYIEYLEELENEELLKLMDEE
jgi:hypothetical protein